MEKLSLAVFNTQPPHLYFGGVERRILETGKRLTNRLDITVYSGTKSGFHKRASVSGVNIVPCNSTDRLFPIDNWTFNRTLAKMANKIHADVYESHNVSAYKFQKVLKKTNKDAPFITTVHGVLADEYIQGRLRGNTSTREKLANFLMQRLSKLEEESANNSTLVVTISKYSQKKIEQLYNVETNKIRIVPNGVDPEKFRPIGDCRKNKELLGVADKKMVLFVGRLIPRKGLSFLVEAAEDIVNERKDTVFVIVGEGPSKSQMMTDVKKANLGNNFAFLGDVSEEELPLLYSCADVFAFPSIQEGQGIVLLEAQSSATPVVAFNISGIAEAVVDKETGLLVNPSTSEFAESILKLLSDEVLRKRLGEMGRERILKEFSWDVCAKKMLDIYHEVAMS